MNQKKIEIEFLVILALIFEKWGKILMGKDFFNVI
jgi:hypothetical protein